MTAKIVKTYPELRRVLTARRQALHLTQDDVERTAGLPRYFVRQFEGGSKHLSSETMARLLVALGVQLYLRQRSTAQ